MSNVSVSSPSTDLVATPTEWAEALPLPATRSSGRVGRIAQRGMVTAEYAVGLLAAVALALVLLRVFTHADFFKTLLKFVVKLIGKIGGMIP